MKPDRIYGIDFSGAREAGYKIWITSGVVDGGSLLIDDCQPAWRFFDCEPALEPCLRALRAFIARSCSSVFGLDFPFGLPHILVEASRWEEFALGFGEFYPDPESFKRQCTQASLDCTGGRSKELKRDTDKAAKTPFSPYNEWIYKQTFYGIRDVLAPLVRSESVCVLPMQAAEADIPWVIETCPRSTLIRNNLDLDYKDGKGGDRNPVRRHIVKKLQHVEQVTIPRAVRTNAEYDREGDALDSIIAAIAAFRALQANGSAGGTSSPSRIEGFVYV